MSTRSMPTMRLPRSPRQLAWLGYWAFWLAMGVFLAIAELQHYLRDGGEHPWEPFLWEISSLLSIGLLALVVYRWHRRLLASAATLPLLCGHALGVPLFACAHVAMILLLRGGVYALVGHAYEPGTLFEMLAYEGAKDAALYVIMVAVCHGVVLFFAEGRRREELARLNTELVQAKLTRLQEQVQPHFLFNTLNLVSSVMYEDLDRADRILANLADLLRQSLAANRALFHSVALELRVIEPFLAIMRERFGERLRVGIDIDAEAATVEIPSLLLINAVENAVKHGVAKTEGSVAVMVRAFVVDDRLRLEVIDSAGQLDRNQDDCGFGLSSTRERIQAIYGAAASLALVDEAGQTCFRLDLPLRARP